MPKRVLFTNITPLPVQITRELAIAMLHNHNEMIQLNPLVIEHHPIKTPRDAPADEFLDCVWQEMTDKIHYLPGGVVKGKVTYKGCFHDTPVGLQTHIYAPLGLDIREKWSIGGTLPGEPHEPRELGVELPRDGLYLREDGDLHCSRLMMGFVRKTLDQAHKVLVERIVKKAERIQEHHQTQRDSVNSQTPGIQPGSHLANSAFVQSPTQPEFNRADTPQMLSPQQDGHESLRAEHPAFRNDDTGRYSNMPIPSYQAQDPRESSYGNDIAKWPQDRPSKQFVAELPGSTYHTTQVAHSSGSSQGNSDNRMSTATELSASDTPANMTSPNLGSDRSSVISDGPPPPGGYRYNPQDFAPGGRSSTYGYDRTNRVSELLTPPMQNQSFAQQQQQPQYR